MSKKSDKGILDSLNNNLEYHRQRLRFHHAQADKYQKAIDGITKSNQAIEFLSSMGPDQDMLLKAILRRNFEGKILGILADERKALSHVVLYNRHKAIYGDHLSLNSFIGMVSGLIKRKGSIKSWKAAGKLTLYGLSEWFEGDELINRCK